MIGNIIQYFLFIISLVTGILYFYVAKRGFDAYQFLQERKFIYFFVSFSIIALSFFVIMLSYLYTIIHLEIHTFISMYIYTIIFMILYVTSLIILAKMYVDELFITEQNVTALFLSIIFLITPIYTGYSITDRYIKYNLGMIMAIPYLILIMVIIILSIFITFTQYLNIRKRTSYSSIMVFLGFFVISISFLFLFIAGYNAVNFLLFNIFQLASSILIAIPVIKVKNNNEK